MKTLQLTTSNLKTLIAVWILSIGIAVYATISIDNKYNFKDIEKREKQINSLQDSILVQKTVNKLLRTERLSEKKINENTTKNRTKLQAEIKQGENREKFLIDSLSALSDSSKTLLFARLLNNEDISQ